jgi:hypothetical protein
MGIFPAFSNRAKVDSLGSEIADTSKKAALFRTENFSDFDGSAICLLL